MDNEQQVRFNFLEEAEEYIDRIEAVLLEISVVESIVVSCDQALRAAHSLKGGAATMGFMPMSQIAHRLEDFFKILRVRSEAQQQIDVVEPLLLQGVDILRQVRNLHREQVDITDLWLTQHSQPIFDQLQACLGDLCEEDENALMLQEDGNDAALLLFEDGVESAIESLSEAVDTSSGESLRQIIDSNAQLLAEFGRMAALEDFVDLCQGIQHRLSLTVDEDLGKFAQRTLMLWERSQGMVFLGQADKLGGLLELLSATTEAPSESPEYVLTTDIESVEGLADPFEFEISSGDIADITPIEEPVILDSSALGFDVDVLDGSDIPVDEQHVNELLLSQDNSALSFSDADTKELSRVVSFESIAKSVIPTDSETVKPKRSSERNSETGRTIRVSVDELQQFNALFGELILERNTINLRLEQLQKSASLIRKRMQQLEQSNRQIRQWYEQISLTGSEMMMPVSQGSETVSMPPAMGAISLSDSGRSLSTFQNTFDVLEMDQYTDFNLLSQEQTETMVQLQEVVADLDLNIREMAQASSHLNQTTRSLQKNVKRTQMRPIADILKRFPRMVRDLALKYDKPAQVIIEGDRTLLDRAILESLGDPIRHIIRNAFDHGLEDGDTRALRGKPPEGVIKVSARHRGNQSVIQIQDDGGGLDFDKIRDRALQMGFQESLIQESSDQDLVDLIFEPGFSTAQSVTDLSGRGVGMDAVRTAVQSIRGNVVVETRAGFGTTFTINVPLTLAVMRVLILETAGIIFALPADSVKEVVRLDDETHLEQKLREFEWQGKTHPLIHLDHYYTYHKSQRLFKMEGSPKVNHSLALMIRQYESWGGLFVQRIWREEEVTTTPIQSLATLPAGFGSATILGDGRVVPILDPISLLELTQSADGRASLPTGESDVVIPESDSTLQARILVIDDSINVRQYLAMTLEKAGYEVEQSKDGQEALTLLTNGLQVSAVISDIEMPRLDGYRLLSELRSQPKFESLPIAMLTSRNSDRHRKLALKLGASAYLVKPFTETELLQTVDAMVAISA